MNIGSNKTVKKVRSYTLPNKIGRKVTIRQTRKEQDLGIILTHSFKFIAQVAYAAAKANKMFAMLKRMFLSRDIELWTLFYRTYIFDSTPARVYQRRRIHF